MERATVLRFAEQLRRELQAGKGAGIRTGNAAESPMAASLDRGAAEPRLVAASLDRGAADPSLAAASLDRDAADPSLAAASLDRGTADPSLVAASLDRDAAEPPLLVPASRYRDPARYELERDTLFRGPRIVAASASLQAGMCLPVDLPGRSALVVRGTDGVVRAFANACRHRGTRLVDKPCSAKAFVCPYHAWTYDHAGKLVHVPHADAFAGVDLNARGLTPLPVTERHGLVWLGGTAHAAGLDHHLGGIGADIAAPGFGGDVDRYLGCIDADIAAPGFRDDIDHYLGGVGADIAALGLEQHVMWQRATTTRRCNWKLVIEAFLDGYHIRVLHRESVYRFFLDAASVAEREGPHIRAITGRRALLEAPADLSGVDLHQLATPSLLLFPSTVFVEHPDFLSIMTVHPLAPDLTAWDHMMLIPASRAGEVEHWNRSWQLIEEGVFQREDLWVCEQAQHSINAGAIDELLFGALESPARWFHAALDARLSA